MEKASARVVRSAGERGAQNQKRIRQTAFQSAFWPSQPADLPTTLRAAGALLFCNYCRSLRALWSKRILNAAIPLSRFLIDGHH